MNALCKGGNAGGAALDWCERVGLIDERGLAKNAIVANLEIAAKVLEASDKAMAIGLRKKGPKSAMDHFDRLDASGALPGCGNLWDAFETKANAVTGKQSLRSSALQVTPMVMDAVAAIAGIRKLNELAHCKLYAASKNTDQRKWISEELSERCSDEPTDADVEKAAVAAVDSMLKYIGGKYICK